MSTLFEIVNPSYFLFPALVGTMIMGLVCPLVGSFLVLRRTVFLGLTLPEIAARGRRFYFLDAAGWALAANGRERTRQSAWSDRWSSHFWAWGCLAIWNSAEKAWRKAALRLLMHSPAP